MSERHNFMNNVGNAYYDNSVDMLKNENTFCFRCTRCGECCKNRNDIILDTFDVCRIAEYMGMENIDFCEKYTELYYDEKIKLPLSRIKMREDTGKCPFLSDDNKCSIHDISPSVCRLYPLGRACFIENEEQSPAGYFLQDVPCGERDEIHTISSWIRQDAAQSTKEFLLWAHAQDVFSTIMQCAEMVYAEDQDKLTHAGNCVAALLYVNYKKGVPAYEQLKENTKEGELYSAMFRSALRQ